MVANDIHVDRKRKYKVTTDSTHSLGAAPNLIEYFTIKGKDIYLR